MRLMEESAIIQQYRNGYLSQKMNANNKSRTSRLHPPPPPYDRDMFTSKIFKTLDTEAAEATQSENLKTGEHDRSESVEREEATMKTGEHNQSESLESEEVIMKAGKHSRSESLESGEAIMLLWSMFAITALCFPSYQPDSFTRLPLRRENSQHPTDLGCQNWNFLIWTESSGRLSFLRGVELSVTTFCLYVQCTLDKCKHIGTTGLVAIKEVLHLTHDPFFLSPSAIFGVVVFISVVFFLL
jgi:hypothetical protein